MTEPKSRRDRATELCDTYWREEFSSVPQVKELVIDLMVAFAQKEFAVLCPPPPSKGTL